MASQISRARKTTFYLGLGFMVLGSILFASTCVLFFMHAGEDADGGASAPPGKAQFTPALGGMGLVLVGLFLRRLGARGLAGSGFLLDPGLARKELEPYSRMAGGMAKDALEEAQAKLGAQSTQVVVIRCRACRKLNEEDSKFCQECGRPLST